MALSPAIVRLLRAAWPDDLNRLWLRWLELSLEDKAFVFEYRNQLLGSISAYGSSQPLEAEFAQTALQNLLMCEGLSPRQLWTSNQIGPEFAFMPALVTPIGRHTGFFVDDTKSWMEIKALCPGLKKQLPFSISSGYLLSVNKLLALSRKHLGYTAQVSINCSSPESAFRLLLANTLHV